MVTYSARVVRNGSRRVSMAILLPGLALAAVSGSAWSQSITYGPLAAAIPSLGGVALVLLSAAMFLMLWRMKKSGLINGSRFMAVALVTGALASGLSGVKLVVEAHANGGAAPVDLDQAGGGSAQLQEGLNCVRNVTSVIQEIRSIDAVRAPWFDNAGCLEQTNQVNAGFAAECSVGTRLDSEYACGVFVQTPPSDLRLKADIVRVGMAGNGLPIYEFRYLGGETRYRGVMAQDVRLHTPEAVVTMPNGYMAVRYDMLGLEMTVAD